MARKLTNKKLFYNKVDCNQQLPGVTQSTKKSRSIENVKKRDKRRNNKVNKKGTNKEKSQLISSITY